MQIYVLLFRIANKDAMLLNILLSSFIDEIAKTIDLYKSEYNTKQRIDLHNLHDFD